MPSKLTNNTSILVQHLDMIPNDTCSSVSEGDLMMDAIQGFVLFMDCLGRILFVSNHVHYYLGFAAVSIETIFV